MLLEVKHLRLVESIATYHSLTNASKHLNLTQSALSHQLNELERRLGTPLFHRVGRRLVPTQAGDHLLRGATRMLAILRRTESGLKRIAAGQEAVLRISTGCYTTYHWLPSLLEEYARRCPKVEVQVVADATRRPIDALLAGKIDVALMSNPPADERLEITPLFEDDMVLLVPPSHRLAPAQWAAPEDFADEHLIIYTEPRHEATIFHAVLEPAGVVPRKVSAIQLTEAILEMVKAGLGVTVLARWAVEPYVRSGALHAVPVTKNGLRRTWSAVTLRHQATPLYVREFCRLLAVGPKALEQRADLSIEGTA
jgi:LysR family transcriptional regulator for metE and metH